MITAIACDKCRKPIDMHKKHIQGVENITCLGAPSRSVHYHVECDPFGGMMLETRKARTDNSRHR